METATLENPVIKDSEESKFLEAATLADKGEDIPTDLISAKPEPPAPGKLDTTDKPPDGKQTPVNPESAIEQEPSKKERKRDAQGRFLKDDGSVDPDQTEKPKEEKPSGELSDFEKKKQEKAAKEKERQDRSWEALNREKDEVRSERQRIAQKEQELAQRYQQPNQRQLINGQRQYSSREMAEAANEFSARADQAYEAGDIEAAKENRSLAHKAYAQAEQLGQIELQEQHTANRTQFQQTWNAYANEEIRTHPDDHKEGTAVYKEMVSLMEDKTLWPIFEALPDGFAKAGEIARLRVDASAASGLRDENQKLRAEVERLNGLTTPSGSGPTKPSETKPFDSMSPDEQDHYLVRQAERFDSGQ